jgi:hypothetical protein
MSFEIIAQNKELFTVLLSLKVWQWKQIKKFEKLDSTHNLWLNVYENNGLDQVQELENSQCGI